MSDIAPEHALLWTFVERELPWVKQSEFLTFARRELIPHITEQWLGDIKFAAWIAKKVAECVAAEV